jgi:hypothetical protein
MSITRHWLVWPPNGRTGRNVKAMVVYSAGEADFSREQGKQVEGPFVPEPPQGAVDARVAADTFLSEWDDWRMGRSTKSDLARAVGALRAALGGQ